MLEKEIEAYFVTRVQALGGKAWKFNSASARGVSDRIACLPNGETWFVELKTAKGVLTPLQKLFGAEMARLNQKYVVLRSKGDVDQWITNLDLTRKAR